MYVTLSTYSQSDWFTPGMGKSFEDWKRDINKKNKTYNGWNPITLLSKFLNFEDVTPTAVMKSMITTAAVGAAGIAALVGAKKAYNWWADKKAEERAARQAQRVVNSYSELSKFALSLVPSIESAILEYKDSLAKEEKSLIDEVNRTKSELDLFEKEGKTFMGFLSDVTSDLMESRRREFNQKVKLEKARAKAMGVPYEGPEEDTSKSPRELYQAELKRKRDAYNYAYYNLKSLPDKIKEEDQELNRLKDLEKSIKTNLEDSTSPTTGDAKILIVNIERILGLMSQYTSLKSDYKSARKTVESITGR